MGLKPNESVDEFGEKVEARSQRLHQPEKKKKKGRVGFVPSVMGTMGAFYYFF